MKKFAIKPPCNKPPLAQGQRADPTSLKSGEDFPHEWEKHQAKLARKAKEAVKRFNEESAAAVAAGASASNTAPKKVVVKKSTVKPKSSAPKSLAPIS